MEYLLEGCRVDELHAHHLLQVVTLGPFQFHVQGQEIVNRAGTRCHGMPPPDTLHQQELFRIRFVLWYRMCQGGGVRRFKKLRAVSCKNLGHRSRRVLSFWMCLTLKNDVYGAR